MGLSNTKREKINAAKVRAHREGNLRAVAITKSLHSPFMETNWDQQARDYLRTGAVDPRSFLAMQFASEDLVP